MKNKTLVMMFVVLFTVINESFGSNRINRPKVDSIPDTSKIEITGCGYDSQLFRFGETPFIVACLMPSGDEYICFSNVQNIADLTQEYHLDITTLWIINRSNQHSQLDGLPIFSVQPVVEDESPRRNRSDITERLQDRYNRGRFSRRGGRGLGGRMLSATRVRNDRTVHEHSSPQEDSAIPVPPVRTTSTIWNIRARGQ